jgi:hypothetical protein
VTPLTLIVLAAFYLVAGSIFLIWPRRMQALALRQGVNASESYATLLKFIRSHRYIWTLRFIGVISALAALLLIDTAARVRVTITVPHSYIQTVPQRYIQVNTLHSI